jgi:hypothetical protein
MYNVDAIKQRRYLHTYIPTKNVVGVNIVISIFDNLTTFGRTKWQFSRNVLIVFCVRIAVSIYLCMQVFSR